MDCPAVFVQPAPYVVGYSFANFQAQNPTKAMPAQRIDIEHAAIAQAVGGLICALRQIQRSDGALANGSVTADAMAPDLLSQIGNPSILPGVQVQQLKRALAATAQVGVVDAAILADPNNIANIQWTTGGRTAVGDPLAVVVAAAIGQAQMLAAYALAVAQPT